MTPLAHNKSGSFSEGLFQRLLLIYPKAHREEYGPSMNQLFRDQCRDARRDESNWGLFKLWLRVLPDLLRTSMIEHLAAFKEKIMNGRISQLLRSPSTPWKTFRTVFVAIFVLVLTTSVLITFLLPESYESVARVRIGSGPLGNGSYDPQKIQTAFEVMQSEPILGKVVDTLNLRAAWGKKYTIGTDLKTSAALEMLRARIELRPVRNTQLVEIRSYSENPKEAAAIANALADSYRDHAVELKRQERMRDGSEANESPLAFEHRLQEVAIVDRAMPNNYPVRPRKALNIFLGAWAGIVLGLAIGAGIGGLTFVLGQRVRKNPA